MIKNGAKWNLSPPSKSELFPNMGADSGRFNSTKKKIAENTGELTMLWRCNVNNRNELVFNLNLSTMHKMVKEHNGMTYLCDSRDEAPLKIGAKIQKINSEKGDSTKNGTHGKIKPI